MHLQYMSKLFSGTKQGQSFFKDEGLGDMEKTDFRTNLCPALILFDNAQSLTNKRDFESAIDMIKDSRPSPFFP